MWPRFIVSVALVGTAGLLSAPAPALSAEFVADQLIKENGRVYRANLYCRENMWRIEHNNPGAVEVTIVRKDKGLMWMLLARVKGFKTLPLAASSTLACQHVLRHEIAREPIGTEILDGHPTTVSQVTVQEGGDTIVYYEWRAEDVQLPLRIARKDGAWVVDYHNLKLRKLSPQLFELPLHYRPIDP
jgi:hypothetical protein